MDICHSSTFLDMEAQKHIDTVYILHVKNRYWSSELKVLRKENWTDLIIVRPSECIRVKLKLLALDIPVTRQQAALH
jgi:hypothetical protein